MSVGVLGDYLRDAALLLDHAVDGFLERGGRGLHLPESRCGVALSLKLVSALRNDAVVGFDGAEILVESGENFSMVGITNRSEIGFRCSALRF